MIKFISVEEKLIEEDIRLIEEEFDLKLPESYINHMLNYNGGYPESKLYFGEYPIGGFRAIKYGDTTLETMMNSLSGVLPDKSLPFGYSSGGILYMTLGVNYGNIYITYSDGQTDFLANSFEGFIDCLSTEQDI